MHTDTNEKICPIMSTQYQTPCLKERCQMWKIKTYTFATIEYHKMLECVGGDAPNLFDQVSVEKKGMCAFNEI